MKTTTVIAARISNIERDIKYISDQIINDPEFADKKLVIGTSTHPEWRNDDYLLVLVAQQSILEWVLNN